MTEPWIEFGRAVRDMWWASFGYSPYTLPLSKAQAEKMVEDASLILAMALDRYAGHGATKAEIQHAISEMHDRLSGVTRHYGMSGIQPVRNETGQARAA
jgi:hypothetical protein